ncbi:MAG: hypothetical protein Q9178_002448 [Gyalolechia marmorata]
MAVLGDLRVVINVDKQPRTDFPDDETDNPKPNFVSRYVECWSGAKFSVQLFIKKTMVFKSGAIFIRLYVDGLLANNAVIEHSRVLNHYSVVYLHNFEGALEYDEALQTLLLIPRSPSPAPPVPLEKRPVESLSVEEMQQLVRQYQSRLVDNEASAKLESTLVQQHIKQEKGVKQENGVKRERDPEMEEILASAYVKKPKTAETVDLSE